MTVSHAGTGPRRSHSRAVGMESCQLLPLSHSDPHPPPPRWKTDGSLCSSPVAMGYSSGSVVSGKDPVARGTGDIVSNVGGYLVSTLRAMFEVVCVSWGHYVSQGRNTSQY